ncbi:hypothetical protein GAY29_22930 [Azospirillum brasilense]|uniref:hypothetical protein n=1 Tax=Azospirillum brasilense TaxID=192 RepID=UPI00190987BE|nr:hypothetical protein [Azospirillum brasilense]MBK3735902.1 hypothetical protein [Azospirillum brasilense]
MQHGQSTRRWADPRRSMRDSAVDAPASRPARPVDPVVMALNLLNSPRTRAALLKAVEERVKTDAEERRRFAAAAGRVQGATGEPALTQAVGNYLRDLSRLPEAGRSGPYLWLAETVAILAGGGGRPGQPATLFRDPRAEAEALFRPRGAASA